MSAEHLMTQKILIVEDEEDVAKGLELNLKKEGYGVLKPAAATPRSNLAIIREPPFDSCSTSCLPGIERPGCLPRTSQERNRDAHHHG
jgi:DNA-binding NtrC family response regulator